MRFYICNNIDIKLTKLKRLVYISVFLGFILLANRSISQGIQFSQFYSSPMILGPSFTGMTDGSRMGFNYRDQWPKIPGTFVTYALSYDQYFDKMKSGLGLLMIRDQAGTGNLSLTDVGVNYSYVVLLNKASGLTLRPGVQFKFSQRGIDFEKLIFGDQLSADGTVAPNTIEVPPLSKTGYVDMSSSLLIYSPFYWGGLTIDHMFMPNQSLTGSISKVPIKLALYGGFKIPLSSSNRRRLYEKESESITIATHYRFQDGYDQLDLGAYWSHSPFVIGLWFRGMPVIKKPSDGSGVSEKLDAVIVLVGYRIFNLSFGYSYDFTVSKLISSTGGSHELSLVYEFEPNVRKKQKHAIISCPKF